MNDDRLTIAGIEFRSRLWVGTGKYKDFVETQKAIEASGADVVTVLCAGSTSQIGSPRTSSTTSARRNTRSYPIRRGAQPGGGPPATRHSPRRPAGPRRGR